MNEMRQAVPELGSISAELHVRSEGAEVKSGLNDSQWSLFVVDGLLQSHNVPILGPDLLQNLHTHTHTIIQQIINQSATLFAAVEYLTK